MKKGLPNILPLPTSCQKPSQVFWQCPFSFALFFGKHKHVAHSWTGVEFAWLLAQDGAGGLELATNAFKIIGQVSDIDDLKEVLPSPCLHFRGKRNDSCSGVPLFFSTCALLCVDWLCALRVCSDRAQRKARRHNDKTSEIECVHRMRLQILRFCAVRRSRRKWNCPSQHR